MVLFRLTAEPLTVLPFEDAFLAVVASSDLARLRDDVPIGRVSLFDVPLGQALPFAIVALAGVLELRQVVVIALVAGSVDHFLGSGPVLQFARGLLHRTIERTLHLLPQLLGFDLRLGS